MTPFQTDGRGPFKRASILMFVLSGVLLLFTSCFGLLSMMPFDSLPPESKAHLQKLDANFTPQMFRQIMIVWTVMMFLPAAAMLVMGIGLRSAKRGWVVASMVVVGLVALLLSFSLLTLLVQAASNPGAICSVALLAVPTALFVLLFVWLIGCYKAVDNVKAVAAMQQQPGYWQYAQQQPMQHPPQTGYGYGYQAPPPAQNPPPTDQTNRHE